MLFKEHVGVIYVCVYIYLCILIFICRGRIWICRDMCNIQCIATWKMEWKLGQP